MLAPCRQNFFIWLAGQSDRHAPTSAPSWGGAQTSATHPKLTPQPPLKSENPGRMFRAHAIHQRNLIDDLGNRRPRQRRQGQRLPQSARHKHKAAPGGYAQPRGQAHPGRTSRQAPFVQRLAAPGHQGMAWRGARARTHTTRQRQHTHVRSAARASTRSRHRGNSAARGAAQKNHGVIAPGNAGRQTGTHTQHTAAAGQLPSLATTPGAPAGPPAQERGHKAPPRAGSCTAATTLSISAV